METQATINQDKKVLSFQTGNFNTGDTLQVKLKVKIKSGDNGE
ncbi:MAG: hypothetical protein ACLTE2_05835 [Eubacteriales bacterium]